MTMQLPVSFRSGGRRLTASRRHGSFDRSARHRLAEGEIVSLGSGDKGLRGVVVEVGAASGAGARGPSFLEQGELERRLLEMGFVEGATVEILHEGVIGRDPIGVRLDDMRVALRRREAESVLVRIQQADLGEDEPRFLEAAE